MNRPEIAKAKKGKGFLVMLILALAAAGYGFYYLKTHPRPLGGKIPVIAPGASLPGPLEPSAPAPAKGAAGSTVAAPAAPAVQPAAPDSPTAPVAKSTPEMPSLPVATVDVVQSAASMPGISVRLDDLSKQVSALAEIINQLIASNVQTREQVTQLAERMHPAQPVVAATRPPQRVKRWGAAAAPPKSAVSAPLVNGPGSPTQLVSVDFWNGAPSVAISEGPTLRFLSPGDATAQGLIVKSVDTAAQKVTFATPSGETVVAGVEARNP
jgi:hypothetical protein